MFQHSSAVEQVAVNHLVPGSNPGAGAIFFCKNALKHFLKKWRKQLDLVMRIHRYFCINKNEPTWFDHFYNCAKGSIIKIVRECKARGQSYRCWSHFFCLVPRQKNTKSSAVAKGYGGTSKTSLHCAEHNFTQKAFQPFLPCHGVIK